MKTKILRKLLLFWAYFIGIGAVVGALMMFIDPGGKIWGMEPMLPLLREGLPKFRCLFDNFIISGMMLLLVNGITNWISAFLIHRKNHWAPLSSVICGAILMSWTSFEYYVFGDIAVLIILYFIFGLLQIITGLGLIIKLKKQNRTKVKIV